MRSVEFARTAVEKGPVKQVVSKTTKIQSAFLSPEKAQGNIWLRASPLADVYLVERTNIVSIRNVRQSSRNARTSENSFRPKKEERMA